MTESAPFRERASGILLHPTSLPGPHGVGDIGPSAHRFIDFLRSSGQSWWQMLPIGPPGAGNSPYDSPSAFAGSPLLISLERLADMRLLDPSEIRPPRALIQAKRARYREALSFRSLRLRKAFERFDTSPDQRRARAELQRFRERSHAWLPDYALFSALSAARSPLPWTAWGRELQRRQKPALARARNELASEIRFFEFLQYVFDLQWAELHTHAKTSGIRLLGDIPMFVAHNGADAWSNQQFFHFDAAGNRKVVAGVPPDPFSKTGQLWGNPLYDWKTLKSHDYVWWVERFKSTLERFDAVRIDHFIGLHRCWEVPSRARDARRGRFVRVPGEDLLATVRRALGKLPFVAEDLGLLTPEVARLRDDFELPGMAVLQFGFGDGGAGREHEPHAYSRRLIAYTGTHDNDTLLGWLRARPSSPKEAAAMKRARGRLLSYVGGKTSELHWQAIRALSVSVAGTVIFPMQDVLGLGSEARMNVPGSATGNWTWRVRGAELTQRLADRLSAITDVSGRSPQR